MPNSTFEPTVSCDGPPVFDLPCLVPLASPLLVDYCLVQASGTVTQAWRDALEGAGASFLEAHSIDALLVSMPDGECNTLQGISGTRKVCAYRTAYKPFWSLEPLAFEIVPPELLLDDGRLHMTAQVHRGEDPELVEAALETAAFACVVEVSSSFSNYPGLEHASRSVEVFLGNPLSGPIDGPCAKDVLAWLSCAEPVEAIAVRPQARALLDESSWYVQTSIPDPLGGHDFDVSARLFANGVTGRGQVVAVADSGLDNDSCHFMYGPNRSDATQFLPDAIYPPPVAATSHGRSDGQNPQSPDPNWRPDNKVVAYYWPGSKRTQT